MNWLYTVNTGPRLCDQVISDGRRLLEQEDGTSTMSGTAVDGLQFISKGARPLLEKLLAELEKLQTA